MLSVAAPFSFSLPLTLQTNSIPESLHSHSILSTSSFFTATSEVIRSCKADAYVLVSQPGIHVEDVTIDKNAGVHLKDLIDGVDKSGRWVVENVYVDEKKDMVAVIEALQDVVVKSCDALVEGVDAKSTATLPLRPKSSRS